MDNNPEPSPYYDDREMEFPSSIAWETPEYTHHERTKDWYWGLGIGSAALIGLGIYLHDPLFSALIAIATVAVVMYALRAPNIIMVELTPRGIKMENQLYPYLTLASFWLTTTETDRKLIIRSKKKLMPWIVIPVPDDADEHLIREFLLQHIREEMHEMPLIDTLMEKLRF